MFNTIWSDFQGTFSCVLIACFLALLCMVLRVLYLYNKREKLRFVVLLGEFLFLTYFVTVWLYEFFAREPGSAQGMVLLPFQDWMSSGSDHIPFVEAVLMYIPFGVLLPTVWEGARKLTYVFFASMLTSGVLEIMQLWKQRGVFQVDDIIANTIGGAIGFILWGFAITIINGTHENKGRK